jgi:predicted nucleic acid-binding protein
VLYPAYLCDTLLRLAEASAYRPLWSADVLAELRRDLIGRGIAAERVDRRIAHMARSFPDALVDGYESLIDGMTNDPKDRHVLAAAIRANAEVLVTFNMSDFPEPALKPYDVVAIHPDEFLLDQLDLYPGVTVEVMRQQAASLPSRADDRVGRPRAARTGWGAKVRGGGTTASLAVDSRSRAASVPPIGRRSCCLDLPGCSGSGSPATVGTWFAW